jgi:hypothetical protein
LDLPIVIKDINGISPVEYMLRLRGSGYQVYSNAIKELNFYEDLPKCRANLTEEGSMAAFSVEEVDFGALERDESSCRFVILYNLHPTMSMKFEF